MNVLVLDAGSTTIRTSVVDEHGRVRPMAVAPFPRTVAGPGTSEFDAATLGRVALELCQAAVEVEKVDVVAITAQRASTVLWEASTRRPVGPGLGWQDLRTTGECLAQQRNGLRLSPNQSATKLSYLLRAAPSPSDDLRFGTIDSYLAAVLSNGAMHATDLSNAAVTGLLHLDASGFDEATLSALSIPPSVLPELVDTAGVLGHAVALPGSPVIAALVGDQQASLVGQGAPADGIAKVTFGTGAMADVATGSRRPAFDVLGDAGCIPIVAWRLCGEITWGAEAVMLSAGSCVDWLVRAGLAESPSATDELAASVSDTGGVHFVPALNGIGTPLWDFGARGGFFGIGPATGRAELVRAVLEGIALRGADLVEALEADSGCKIDAIHLDGGMSKNATFVDLLASATRCSVLLSSEVEATTRGAGLLAHVGVGTHPSLEKACAGIAPRRVVEPSRRLDRERWLFARARALGVVPALSALKF